MKITKPEDIKIGQFFTCCCHLDLAEIETKEDVLSLVEDMGDDQDYEIWDTKKNALLDIREGWNTPEEINEIDEMLTKCV